MEEHDKDFSVLLLRNLNKALEAIKVKTIAALDQCHANRRKREHELSRIHIRQIDYTQDLLGFFVSAKINEDLTTLADELGFKVARDFKQLMTCIQMEKYKDADNRETRVARVKVYNKSVHLLTSGQFKKWLTMDLDKLITPEQAFYMKKVQPS